MTVSWQHYGEQSAVIDRSVLVAGSSDCSVTKDQGLNLTADGCVYHDSHCDSLGHGLHNFTTVLRSTQPSTLRGTVIWVSAYGLSNNNNGDDGCGW